MPVPVTPSKIRSQHKPLSAAAVPAPAHAQPRTLKALVPGDNSQGPEKQPALVVSDAPAPAVAPSPASAPPPGTAPVSAPTAVLPPAAATVQAPLAAQAAAEVRLTAPPQAECASVLGGPAAAAGGGPAACLEATAPVAVHDSLGALLPGMDVEDGARRRRPHLSWDGRWGRWGDVDAVYICAPHVATFEVEMVGGAVSMSEVIRELQSSLRTELQEEPPTRQLISVHEGGRSLHVKAAFICKKSRCDKLEKAWQGRQLCGGRVTSTWKSTWDTAHEKHVEKVRQYGQHKAWADAAALELPSRWAFRILPSGNCAALSPGSHWYQFASVFGEVDSAELVWGSQFDKVVHLLVRFRSAGSAATMHEMLMGRYLWNPMTQKAHQRNDDAYPLVCVVDPLMYLRARALASAQMPVQALVGVAPATPGPQMLQLPPSASSAAAPWVQPLPPAPAGGPAGPVFQLRRLDLGAGMPLSEIRVAPWRREAIIGREETCDLVVRCHHMSRHHAILRLIGEAKPGGREVLSLWIQDKSTNGVWINDRKMAKGNLVQLHEQDKISFEADVAEVPAFRVRRFRDVTHCEEDEAQRAANFAMVQTAPAAGAAGGAVASCAASPKGGSQIVPECPVDPPGVAIRARAAEDGQELPAAKQARF